MADPGKARWGAAVYALGLVALFGVSGTYHRGRWSQAALRRMQKLDHATIFVMIAGSYTPLCLLALRGWVAPVMLVAAWIGASVGAVLAFTGGRRSRVARGALYISLGWISIVATPQLLHHLSISQLVLIAIGGVLYTVGAIFLATRWPDPFPKVFGYHEVWHVLVVAAVVCHFVAISSLVHGQIA
jgi:hemolysin III